MHAASARACSQKQAFLKRLTRYPLSSRAWLRSSGATGIFFLSMPREASFSTAVLDEELGGLKKPTPCSRTSLYSFKRSCMPERVRGPSSADCTLKGATWKMHTSMALASASLSLALDSAKSV